VGRRLGAGNRLPWNPAKSWAGSAAMFLGGGAMAMGCAAGARRAGCSFRGVGWRRRGVCLALPSQASGLHNAHPPKHTLTNTYTPTHTQTHTHTHTAQLHRPVL
jgi:hypothetical protein